MEFFCSNNFEGFYCQFLVKYIFANIQIFFAGSVFPSQFLGFLSTTSFIISLWTSNPWPVSAAICRGVTPLRDFGSANSFSMILQTFKWPLWTAKWKGVLQHKVGGFLSDKFIVRKLQISKYPYCAANWRGLNPFSCTGFASPVFSMIYLQNCKLPHKVAIQSGCHCFSLLLLGWPIF